MTKTARLNHTIEESIDVEVPTRIAYDQWTQLERFPTFMPTISDVRQIDDRRTKWNAHIQGRPVEWTAEIVEQIPDKRIAWQSTGGLEHAGVVTFHRLSDETCRLMLQMDYRPDGLAERTAAGLGLVRGQIRRHLAEFRDFVEARGASTGSWRGEIPNLDDTASEEDGTGGSDQ